MNLIYVWIFGIKHVVVHLVMPNTYIPHIGTSAVEFGSKLSWPYVMCYVVVCNYERKIVLLEAVLVKYT